MKRSGFMALFLFAGLVGCNAILVPDATDTTMTSDVVLETQRAEVLHREGKDLLALEVLDTLLDEGADDFRVHRLRQDVLIGLDREEEVREELTDVLNEDAGNVLALVLLARLETEGEARAVLERALAQDPDYPWAHYGMGVLEARELNFEAADRHFSLALAAGRDFPEALVARAQVRDRLADFEGAVADYREYLKYRPASADAIYNYASILHRELDRSDGAEELYRLVLDMDPSRTDAVVGLAVCLTAREDYAVAEELYLGVMDREPSALFNLGMLYQEQLGRYDEAEECFERFLDFEQQEGGSPPSMADRLIYAPVRLQELREKVRQRQLRLEVHR